MLEEARELIDAVECFWSGHRFQPHGIQLVDAGVVPVTGIPGVDAVQLGAEIRVAIAAESCLGCGKIRATCWWDLRGDGDG